jgi:hypothetical protein
LAADWEVGVTLFHSLGIVAYSGVSAAAPGMVLMNPTSIAYSGTSATLGANGQVTFSAVTSLSLNGCFTADFDNYVVSIRGLASGASPAIFGRLRAAGTDATGTDYTYQYLYVDNTSVSAARSSTNNGLVIGDMAGTYYSGVTTMIYGPFLAQPTASRNVSAWGLNQAFISDYASTHSLSTSYDGITLRVTSQSITGALQVYGVRS